MPTGKRILLLLFTSTLAATLINNSQFESPTMAAYFFYVIAGAVFIIFISKTYYTGSITINISNPVPVIALFGLALYYFLQAKISPQQNINMMHIFLLINSLLLVSFIISFRTNLITSIQINTIITVFALCVAVLCLFQEIGLIKSPSEFFVVSGTWVNPNVTALFLVMALPALLSLYYKRQFGYRKLYIAAIVILLAALILLKCRTAWVGLIVIALINLNTKYQLIHIIRHKYKRIGISLVVLLTLLIIVPMFVYFYNAKQASAEGRKLIWKISAGMVAQKPATGYGYGLFEQAYNLAQANYFKQGNASETEIRNAAHVKMAYNEFLQNAVEGGLIALFFLVLFFLSLLIPFPSGAGFETITAYSGIAAFVAMGLFNFTIQAIPAMLLFIVYAAIIVSNSKQPRHFLLSLKRVPICILLLFAGLYVGFSQARIAIASAVSKDVNQLASKANRNIYLSHKLEPLKEKLDQSKNYWTTYGVALLNEKNYPEALKKFKQAATLSSEPTILLKIATCYQKLGMPDSAVFFCTLAKDMVPNKLSPVFSLMMIYAQQKDITNASDMARQLVSMEPKVPSREAIYYKNVANNFLQKKAEINANE